jgi:hypothetical protein
VEQSDEGLRHRDELRYVRGGKVPTIQCTVQWGPVTLHILQVGADPGMCEKHTNVFGCSCIQRRAGKVEYGAT